MNLEKDYGSIPSTESEAYVLGFLGLTTVKANVPAFMHFGGELDSDTQDQLVKIGSELLHGTITPEEYVNKYEKALIAALPKDKQKDVSFDDYTKEQLKMRVFYSHGLHSKDRKTLKEDVNLTPSNYKVWNVFGEKNGARHGVTIILRAQTDPKKYEEDFRKYFAQSLPSSGRTPITINFEWVASPSEIKKTVVEDLNEAVDNTPKILSFLQANPHATYNAILANLGVDPKSGSAIPVYHQVKKLLASGDIQREQAGRGFLYSVAGTPAAPQPVAPVATATPSNPVSKYSIREPNRVLQIWGASKQEALNHIDHELEYTEGLLDLSKKPEHKAKIEQRIADLKAQKDIIEKSSGVKVTAPTKQAAPPAMGGAAVSQAFKKITKLRDQFIALQKTGKFMIGKIYDIAPNTDPKALAKIIQDDPTRGSRYHFTFYGANDRSRTVSVFFAGSKAGKVFIDDKEMKTKADYAEFLVKKSAKDKKNEALLAQIKNDFYGFRPNAYMKGEVESDSSTVSRSFRGVGDWRNRPGEEDDDSPIWKNEREVTKNFEKWVKQHSWSRYVTPFVYPSEKQWADFGVKLKK